MQCARTRFVTAGRPPHSLPPLHGLHGCRIWLSSVERAVGQRQQYWRSAGRQVGAGARRQRQRASRVAASVQEHRGASGQPSPAPTARAIIVAVDFSRDSEYACDWVVKHLMRTGDVLHVGACIPYYPSSGGIYATPDGRLASLDIERVLEQEEMHLEAAEQRLEHWCGRLFGGRDVRYEVDMLREDPATVGDRSMIGKAICEKAGLLQASAVVIASHAKSMLSELLLGSVADYCTHHCPAPVLILHPPPGRGGVEAEQLGAETTSEPAAHEGWLQQQQQQQQSTSSSNKEDSLHLMAAKNSGLVSSGDFSSDDNNLLGQTADFPGIGSQAAAAFEHELPPRAPTPEGGRRLLLAVDDSDASEKACAWTLENVVRPGDSIALLHVVPTLPVRANYGGPLDGAVFYMPSPPVQDFKVAAEQIMTERFEPALKEAGVPYEREILLEPTEPSVQGIGQAICDRAQQEGAALVVLGSHTQAGLEEFLLGSIGSYVSHHCTEPVAVLH